MKISRIMGLAGCVMALLGQITVWAENLPDRVSGSFPCQEGTLTVDAAVTYQEEAAFTGTASMIPFQKELVKEFFGEPEYWREDTQFGEDTLVYEENGLFEKSVILGSEDEQGRSFHMEMELRSSEEYEAIRQRMKVTDTQQAIDILGISADVTGWMNSDPYYFETLQGKINGVHVAAYSPVKSTGQICYEYGDMTGVQFQGNYEVKEMEPAKLLSMDEILERVRQYTEDGTIKLIYTTGDIYGGTGDSMTYDPEEINTVYELELQYYLERSGDEITFRPVWVFKMPNMLNEMGGEDEAAEDVHFAEDAFYLDAQDGTYLSTNVASNVAVPQG
ncbi:MAG: hypothetical protein Q4E91_04535 [Lachnospiraceae bacterium]|nr:hypothetical protein [Lachnospiraceae bacterium]